VAFTAPWEPDCLYLEPALAELSLRYTSASLKFGRVDVHQWPALGRRFNVSATAATAQLPTLVLFDLGKEVDRVPRAREDGRVEQVRLRAADVVAAFGLDERAAGAAARQAAAPAGAPAAKSGSSKKKRQPR
jgi:thioredoxin-like negative regulator of GroEL